MKEFFLKIWNETPQQLRRCYETEEPIWEPRTVNFHHILPKHKYPQYAFEKWNIVILCWEVHDQVERNIELTPKVKALTIKIREQYA